MNELRIVPALFFGTIVGMLLTLLITTPCLSEAIEFLKNTEVQIQLGLTAISTIAIYILLGRMQDE